MNTQVIGKRIEAKDWGLLDGPLSAQQANEVIPLLKHTDPEVRELAVQALDRIGGPVAKAGLLSALADNNQMTHGAAARALHNHCTAADVPVLARQLEKHEDDYVREQIALLLGKLGERSAIEPLQKQFVAETYPDAKHAMSLALARLGDPEQRQAYIARLAQSDPLALAAALGELPYVHDRSLIPFVRPLLDDRRDAKNVGPSHGPLWIRVCDVAIGALDQLLDHPFPFPVEYGKRYSARELEQAAGVLAKLK